jgi:DNA anti-recombination protein RmuC
MEVMTAMEATPVRWNDDRLDEFARNVDRRFDEVDKRFDKVDGRFDKVDDRLDRISDRFDDLMKLLMVGFISVIGVLGAAILSFVATQL